MTIIVPALTRRPRSAENYYTAYGFRPGVEMLYSYRSERLSAPATTLRCSPGVTVPRFTAVEK